jgi:hypothetical protein
VRGWARGVLAPTRLYQGAGRPLLLHMWHQPRHKKASAHRTRRIAAALVLIVGAASLAALTQLVEHRPTVHSAQARQDEHPLLAPVAPDGPRKGHGRLVRPDVVAPRLDVPSAVRVRSRRSTGRIVRYRAVAVDATDGVVTASCAPDSGTRFPAGFTLVSCTATDRAGNVARAGFAVRVRVIDVTPPRLRLPWRRCFAADRAGNVARGGFAVDRTAPGSVPPLWCFPDGARGATREYSAWTVDQ